MPTAFTTRSGAAVCIADEKELAFAACGNTVKVYSLRTGIQTKSLRSARLLNKGVGVIDVHKANIIAMALNGDQNQYLSTLCARGVFAVWNTDSGELLSLTQLDFQGGKSSLAVIDPQKIVAYVPSLR